MTRRTLAAIALKFLAFVMLGILTDVPNTNFRGCFIAAAGLLFHWSFTAIDDWCFNDDPESL